MSAEVVRLDLPATGKYLGAVGTCIEEMLSGIDRLPEALSQGVQLAVHEACANIVDHAYAGKPGGRMQIILTLDHRSRRLIVELHDSGTSFDPRSAAEPDLEEGQIRGYGLFIVRQVMDEVTHEPTAGDNRWRLVKEL